MISPTFTSCLMNVCKMESNEIRSSISNAITAKILNVAELKDNTGKSYQERKTDIKDLRQRWADLCNSHLEKHQIDSRIDMRSYKEQGIEKDPEKTITKPSQRP